MTLWKMLRHREDLASAYGLPDGVRLHAQLLRPHGREGTIQLLVTVGTEDDHLNRSATLGRPPLDEQEVRKLMRAAVERVVDEWMTPARMLAGHPVWGLEAASAVGLTIWP